MTVTDPIDQDTVQFLVSVAPASGYASAGVLAWQKPSASAERPN